jgi:hypothetical protein
MRAHQPSFAPNGLRSCVDGWPPESESFPVREVLGVVIDEEWWHRQFAERDLDALASREAAPLT